MNKQLGEFLDKEMRMSSFYQPVVIGCLLDGMNKTHTMALVCVGIDSSRSVKAYERILRGCPAKVLEAHGIARCKGEEWRFFRNLDTCEEDKAKAYAKLKEICERKGLANPFNSNRWKSPKPVEVPSLK